MGLNDWFLAKATRRMEVLWEDNHLLFVSKPAGLLTMGDATGDPTLLDAAKDYIRVKYHKPGEVFLGVVHRLDRPVSGVVVFARTSKAAARLSEQFRERTAHKTYRALVAGVVSPGITELHDHLSKDEARNVVRVTSSSGGAEAITICTRLGVGGGVSLVELEPKTGRSHQLRVQLASRGWPILGDSKYGSTQPFTGGIALHAVQLEVEHPTLRTPIAISAPAPQTWQRWLRQCS